MVRQAHHDVILSSSKDDVPAKENAPRALTANADGFRYYPGYLNAEQCSALVEQVLTLAEGAPFFRGKMPRTGVPLNLPTTNLGALGWVSSIEGYRYQAHHPETGGAWPAIPDDIVAIWDALAEYPHPPEACLVNLYRGESAKLGLHIDADELEVNAPVVSISLGDTALFRLGGPQRKGSTRSMKLSSGDVVVLGGASRRFYHGVDRIYPGTSRLIPGGGRINLTMRRVTIPTETAMRERTPVVL